jgi:3',5'-cyclic AMP phosphodiesterase CpdA
MILPGNHDVPIDPPHRFLAPFARYKYYISRQLSPLHRDDEFCLLGLNTARSIVLDGGRFSRKQLERAERIIRMMPKNALRIVATHHPFIRPPAIPRYRRAIAGAETALETFERCGVDLILSGHFHQPHVADLRSVYPSIGRSILHAQTGSALSKRLPRDLIGYNVILLTKNRITITIRIWNGRAFEDLSTSSFVHCKKGWLPEKLLMASNNPLVTPARIHRRPARKAQRKPTFQ